MLLLDLVEPPELQPHAATRFVARHSAAHVGRDLLIDVKPELLVQLSLHCAPVEQRTEAKCPILQQCHRSSPLFLRQEPSAFSCRSARESRAFSWDPALAGFRRTTSVRERPHDLAGMLRAADSCRAAGGRRLSPRDKAGRAGVSLF